MAELPSGTVTFLYSDIEGSTARWEQQPQAMKVAVARHDALLRQTITAHHGQVFRTAGDGLCAAFATAPHAVAAALAAQRALDTEDWGAAGPLRVRMALHTGAVEVQDGDYVGTALNRIARLLAAGHGGQVLLSQTTADLVRGALPEGVNLRELGEHRFRDLVQPEQVYQVIHPDLPTDFPPLRSLDAYHHNLPLQLTSFVGREREMAEAKALLQRTRLLTLTGTGGCGKTRLALQVAADLVDAYPDGVWLVELAPLADPALVPQAVAGALSMREVPGQPILMTLLTVLRSKHLLLVLDNCEHVIDACAHLVEALLRGCPTLRVLATSRELLGAEGEVAWRVPSLTAPESQHLPPDHLLDYEAMRLFVERARQIQPTFAVTERNAAAVAEICRRLDGIPLALELAAARVTALSAEQIAARLGDRFRLLTGGRRTALRRQQTLQAAIDWSYHLLSEPEQRLFNRLSVFAAGWTLEAAEQVGSGDGIESWEVLDLLLRLANKSLVVAEPGDDGTERYRLLEMLRQYGQEKLLAGGEAEQVYHRHAHFFADLAQQAELAEPWPSGTGEQLVWLARLEREHDNLRTALRWLGESGQVEHGLRMGTVLWWFWYTTGSVTEGREVLDWLLSLPAAGVPAVVRAHAQLRAAFLNGAQGHYEQQQHLYAEALATFEAMGDQSEAARTLAEMGRDAYARGDYQTCAPVLERALAVARVAGNTLAAALALGYLGYTALEQGDTARCQTYIDEFVANEFVRRHRHFQAHAAMLRGRLCHQEGKFDEARRLFDTAEDLQRQLRNQRGTAEVLQFRGDLLIDAGEPASAFTDHRAALRIRHRLGDRPNTARSLESLACLTAIAGRPTRALRLAGVAAATRAAIGQQSSAARRAWVERWLASTRAALSVAEQDVAWAAGQALTLEEAIAEALAEEAETAT